MRLVVDARRPFALALAALIGFAWLSLWLWGESPYGRFLSHEGIDAAGGGGLLSVLALLLWWNGRDRGPSLAAPSPEGGPA